MKKLLNKKKVGCGCLLLAMGGIALSQSISCLSKSNVLSSSHNNVSISTVDDNNMKVHYNTASNCNDVMVTKNVVDGGYNYTISDDVTKEVICNFNSPDELSLNETTVNNQQLCAVVHAFAIALKKHNGDIGAAMNELVAGGGAAAAVVGDPAFKAVASLLAGGASVPAVLGLLANGEIIIAAGGVFAIA